VGTSSFDAYVVGSGVDGFRGHLNVRSLPAASAAFSISLHRDIPHHVLDARSGLRTVGRFTRESSAPVVATFHEAVDARRQPTWLDERVTAAILVSESQRPAFRDRFPAERTFVVPYAVDTDRFAPAAAPVTEARIAVPSAGCDETLLTRVTAQTRSQQTDAVFLRVNGSDAQRAAGYQSARVALFPFAPVVASHALLEAMATGMPIVATDVGAVREYTDHAAILVAPDDATALADAVVRVLNEPELAAELGRRARARAVDFDLATAAARHRAVYRWCRRTTNGDGRTHATT
jgi:glycosyltransferase involved in cell wall biosynthesis